MSGKQNDRPARHAKPTSSSSSSPQLYRSYLLRLWSRPEDGESGTWRASLESPITQEQTHFADLESLFTFLRTLTAPAQATGQKPAPNHMGGTD